MNAQRKMYTLLAVLLLIMLFPAVHDFSSCWNGGTEHQAITGPKIQAKLAGPQPPTIIITNNSGFAANFTTGSGESGDPYILDGITIIGGGLPGINISDTYAYFIIRNVIISDSIAAGIWLKNVTNGQIINTTVTTSSTGFYMNDCIDNSLIGNNASGNTNNGFYLTGSKNNTLTDNEANNNFDGIYLYTSDNNTLTGNAAIGNSDTGIKQQGSDNNTLTDNDAAGNNIGFDLDEASYNSLTGNNASGNGYGIYLVDSVNNTLTGNEASGSTWEGFVLDAAHNNTLTGNNATGNAGEGFYLADSDNNTLTGNAAIGNTYDGITLDGSDNNTLTGNTATGNDEGFKLYYYSNYNTLIGNNASGNDGDGFGLSYSNNNNTFTLNTANTNGDNGFDVFSDCDDNTFTCNTASKNEYEGFLVDGCNNNTFTCNTVSENGLTTVEAGFYLTDSDDNNLTWNTFYKNGGHGIWLSGSSGNLVHLNFLIDNNQNNPSATSQGYEGNPDNSWDNGTHGNYWNDYTGQGDTNYTLDGSPRVNDTKPLVPALLKDLSTLQLTGPVPADQVFEFGSTGTYTITWLPVTNIPVNTTYELYIDNSPVDSGNWTPWIPVQVDVDLVTLAMDVEYNYTLVVTDYSNKTAVHTVLLTVKDRTDPVITAPSDFTVDAGPDAGTLTFSATDLDPATYTLYLDGAVNKTDSWTSGPVVTVQLDSFLPGDYNFTLVVLDGSGNDANSTVLVTLIDTANPVITYTGPATITFEEGSTGHVINITATDLYPGNFTLYQDGTGVGTYNWTSGTTVTVSLDDLSLPAGTYNFTLVVRDTSGNEATLTVIVTVTAKPAPPTTPTTPTSTPSTPTTTTTTTTTPSPGWAAPLVLLSLACSAVILSHRRAKRKK